MLSARSALALSLGLLAGCGEHIDLTPSRSAQSFSSALPTEWMRLYLRLIRTEKLSPLVASRLFAYGGVALHEGMAAEDSSLRSLAGQLNGLDLLPSPPAGVLDGRIVANRAIAILAAAQVPAGALPTSTTLPFTRWAIDGMRAQWDARRHDAVPQDVFDRSATYGDSLGQALLAWADADGYAMYHNCSYAPPLGEGLWAPTPPAFARALEPCWGQLRTFVLATADECNVPPPTPFSTVPGSAFWNEAYEVYEAVNDGTAEQRVIAAFWSDDPGLTSTPPGHWISILSQLIERGNLPIDRAAEAYAHVGLAVADAFIACWWTKFRDNLIRPVSYIQIHIDADWLPIVGTPPFPEYTSGHSVQSAAAATVLTALFGARSFIDETHVDRGLAPRYYESFHDAAHEAALSRLYGGIHYRPAIELGIDQGRCIGDVVLQRIRFRN